MAGLPYIVFDVNETLLDLETMAPTFERTFGDKVAMRLWFANLILYSAALTVANVYVPFTDIGAADENDGRCPRRQSRRGRSQGVD
jgi:2-haloacid dehalogenase